MAAHKFLWHLHSRLVPDWVYSTSPPDRQFLDRIKTTYGEDRPQSLGSNFGIVALIRVRVSVLDTDTDGDTAMSPVSGFR